MLTKDTLCDMLSRFIRQRPGLEFANYGDVSAYRSEMRSIARDKRHAETLLAAVRWRDGITLDHLRGALRSAYSGRLSLIETDDGKARLGYCTGQYFPTEYRRAVAAVCASALWDYWRDNAPIGAGKHEPHSNLENLGDYLRRTARQEFGRTIQNRWFN
jgi:hypothetical protein